MSYSARINGEPGHYTPYEVVFGQKNNLNAAIGGQYVLVEVEVRENIILFMYHSLVKCGTLVRVLQHSISCTSLGD